jgi:hypothetical protein
MKHAHRAMLLSLLTSLSAASALVVANAAHAGDFADAAMSNGQAGGNPPSEMGLLGSPRSYADPYGAPTNGRGNRGGGPITGAQTAQGVSPTDRLLAQQNGYVGNPGAGAQLRRGAGVNDDANAKQMMNAQGAAAALYPTPSGLKPPVAGGGAANAARVREIYKSPY